MSDVIGISAAYEEKDFCDGPSFYVQGSLKTISEGLFFHVKRKNSN